MFCCCRSLFFLHHFFFFVGVFFFFTARCVECCWLMFFARIGDAKRMERIIVGIIVNTKREKHRQSQYRNRNSRLECDETTTNVNIKLIQRTSRTRQASTCNETSQPTEKSKWDETKDEWKSSQTKTMMRQKHRD